MAKCVLTGTRILSVSTINKKDPPEEVRVNIRQQLPPLDDNSSMIQANLEFEMYDIHEENEENKQFYVHIIVGGLFANEGIIPEDINTFGKLLAKDIFPFLRASVPVIMAASGMPPYTPPFPDTTE